MTRLIKRYGNRKLYDTKASRYVTLDGIAELVRGEEDLRIIDNDTGEDLTAVTFAQIIYEEAKRSEGEPQVPVFRRIIRQGGATLHEILSQVDRGREAIENVRELAEERIHDVRQLVLGRSEEDSGQAAAGAPENPEERALTREGTRPLLVLNDLLELPQKQLEQVQQRIDAQVRSSIERVTNHPAFRQELHRIEENLHRLERQLGQLRGLAQPGRKEEECPVPVPRKRAGRSRRPDA
jgi:polyhydroxyalkanoate synthesis repressor PhaR